jgi:hypothetical protein
MPLPEDRLSGRRGYRDECGNWDSHDHNLRYRKSSGVT